MYARELYDKFIVGGRKWITKYFESHEDRERCRIGLYQLKKRLGENYSVRQDSKGEVFELTIFDKL